MKGKNLLLCIIIFQGLMTGCKKKEALPVSDQNLKERMSAGAPMAPIQANENVTIGGNKFYVNGKEIFFSGINTAWQKQSDWTLDFLGKNFDYNWWNTELERYRTNRINLARIWIHGNGNSSPSLNGDGKVTGASNAFWTHMDQLVDLAESKGVYIMPTLWSFDMVKQGTGAQSNYYNQYRQIINDVNKTQWYIDNFLIPFVQRYNNKAVVMGYDICNEPEHMWRDSNCGKLPRNNVVRFIARCAAAINQHTTKPVTVGSMWIIFNSNRYLSWDSLAQNNYSNSSLQAQYNNSNAFLDFWSPHWYQWQSSGTPFTTPMANWMDNGDKPVLIGETPGYDIIPSDPKNCCNYTVTMAQFYEKSYQNGYAGVCAWKNPHEDDGYGFFNSIAVGTNSFYAAHPQLVYPNATGTTNLAYNRPVTTSSNESAAQTGAKGVDANGTTRWSSSYANNQNFVVDLGSNYSINRIKINWEAAYAKDYQIQVSTDNVNWTTIRDKWGKNNANADEYTGLNATARWVKLYCINRATAYGFSLWEFEVYGN